MYKYNFFFTIFKTQENKRERLSLLYKGVERMIFFYKICIVRVNAYLEEVFLCGYIVNKPSSGIAPESERRE